MWRGFLRMSKWTNTLWKIVPLFAQHNIRHVCSPETWFVLEGWSMSWRRCQSSHRPLAFRAALSSKFKFTSPRIRPKYEDTYTSKYPYHVCVYYLFSLLLWLILTPACGGSWSTCDRAGGRASMQGDIRVRLRVWTVQPWPRLRFGHPVLAAFGLARVRQQRLLGGGRNRGQVGGPDLLRHQLLLDFIDQD